MPGKGTNVCQDRHVHVRYIRKVTVVTGRGFYTYCSGPPAPFLMIEYYDPKVKWKVKLMLERGLELGLACHPDSCLYDYGGSSTEGHDPNAVREGQDKIGEGSSQDGDKRLLNPPLKFRCYEAHIPYTMQVFKDYNLSGMSYVKVADGRFRQTLPKQEKQRSKGQSRRNHSEALFLESTVPAHSFGNIWRGPRSHSRLNFKSTKAMSQIHQTNSVLIKIFRRQPCSHLPHHLARSRPAKYQFAKACHAPCHGPNSSGRGVRALAMWNLIPRPATCLISMMS